MGIMKMQMSSNSVKALKPQPSPLPARPALRNARAVRCRASAADVGTQLEQVSLGKSGVMVPIIGVGAWSWGDRSGYWGYGKEYGQEESRQAYKALLDAGLTFIDTAEVYGFGKSEEFLGEFIAESVAAGRPMPVVATKFAPQPWRLTSDSVPEALKSSLSKLKLSQVDLYMLHWPGFFFNAFSNDAYVEGLAKAHQQKLCKAVGVSNFRASRVRDTSKRLAQSGIPLASNQVQYSLLYRTPETSGVAEACRETGTTLVAYSPLCQGLLTGKYSADGKIPSGPRGLAYGAGRLRTIAPLLATIKAVATERNKTMAQVSLNWVICKGAVPIPGAKDAKQVEDLAGAAGWRLSDGEMAELDSASAKIPTGTGAPFENW